MKKFIIIFILTIGFVYEGYAQENSELYFYIDENETGDSGLIYLIQIQNYGKKIVRNSLYFYEGLDVEEVIEEKSQKHDWELYEYSSEYSNDKYDTYERYIPGIQGPLFPITSGFTRYYSISKDRSTVIYWNDSSNNREYYRRISKSDIKEMCTVKIPDFLE